MHNTSIEYKQMHNRIISWNDNWILIFICFVGRLLSASPSSSFITTSFLIQILKMDKRFFKNWVLHIPRRLRDLLWMVRAWSSVSLIFSSLIMSLASFCVHYFQSMLKVITSFWYTFLKWMNPMILGSHSRWLSQLLHPLLQVVLWFERPLLLHGLCILDLHILQLVS